MHRSTLFGFDYLSIGDKHFDQQDNFHIEFDPYKIDISGVEYAISNYSDDICEIKSVFCEPKRSLKMHPCIFEQTQNHPWV